MVLSVFLLLTLLLLVLLCCTLSCSIVLPEKFRNTHENIRLLTDSSGNTIEQLRVVSFIVAIVVVVAACLLMLSLLSLLVLSLPFCCYYDANLHIMLLALPWPLLLLVLFLLT